MKIRVLAAVALSLIATASFALAQEKDAKPTKPGLLTAEEVKAALPEQVFFRGEKAPVQLRNAGGIRFAGGRLALITLVETSGYSTAIQEKYQAYLITEVRLKIGAQVLAPGAYGCGIVNGRFTVMDLAANEVFSVDAPSDASMKRPRPFLLTAEGDGYVLHLGKNKVTLAEAE